MVDSSVKNREFLLNVPQPITCMSWHSVKKFPIIWLNEQLILYVWVDSSVNIGNFSDWRATNYMYEGPSYI